MGVSVGMRTGVVQRLRVTYGIEGPLCYASLLDMLGVWARLLRRARVPMAYTQGFNPHQRLQFASPLPVGYSSECELLDVFLAERVAPLEFARAVGHQTPVGLCIRQVLEVPVKARALQATMRAAHYRVRIWAQEGEEEVAAALSRLLGQDTIVRQRIKKRRMVDYDLRPLIRDIHYASTRADCHELYMDLACGIHGSGRPEEVIREMGLTVSHCTIHRCRLIWGNTEELPVPRGGAAKG